MICPAMFSCFSVKCIRILIITLHVSRLHLNFSCALRNIAQSQQQVQFCQIQRLKTKANLSQIVR